MICSPELRPAARPGDDLAELDDAVTAARIELGRAGRKRRERRVALLDDDDVGSLDDRRVELEASAHARADRAHVRARAEPFEADDRLLRGSRGVDDVGAANRILELAATGDPHLGEVARAGEHLLRRARLDAGAEDREDARIRSRQQPRRERGRRGGAHRGDVRPVHERDGRARRWVEERDGRLVRRPVAILGEERDELAAESGGRRVAEHRAENPGLGPGADARHERRLPAGELRVGSRERIEERVEVEQLLHFASAQDQHLQS